DSWMIDLRLLLRVWVAQLPHGVYPLIEVATGAAVAGLCLAARLRAWPRAELLTLLTGLGCCWMTVFGPATESCTYVLIAPTLAAALLLSWKGAQPRWLLVPLLACYGL